MAPSIKVKHHAKQYELNKQNEINRIVGRAKKIEHYKVSNFWGKSKNYSIGIEAFNIWNRIKFSKSFQENAHPRKQKFDAIYVSTHAIKIRIKHRNL